MKEFFQLTAMEELGAIPDSGSSSIAPYYPQDSKL